MKNRRLVVAPRSCSWRFSGVEKGINDVDNLVSTLFTQKKGLGIL